MERRDNSEFDCKERRQVVGGRACGADAFLFVFMGFKKMVFAFLKGRL